MPRDSRENKVKAGWIWKDCWPGDIQQCINVLNLFIHMRNCSRTLVRLYLGHTVYIYISNKGQISYSHLGQGTFFKRVSFKLLINKLILWYYHSMWSWINTNTHTQIWLCTVYSIYMYMWQQILLIKCIKVIFILIWPGSAGWSSVTGSWDKTSRSEDKEIGNREYKVCDLEAFPIVLYLKSWVIRIQNQSSS